MDEYRDYLFSYLPEGRLKTFSFGHVIPPENLSAVTMSNGILGSEFDFTFEKRRSEPL
ncbi:ATP-dependent DNA helicase chl1, partial [Ascosphaera atra]